MRGGHLLITKAIWIMTLIKHYLVLRDNYGADNQVIVAAKKF